MSDSNKHIVQLRKDYAQHELKEEDAALTPILQFDHWMRDAITAKVNEPNAMVLSTVSKDMKPSSRIVLLRGFNENGFGFFTNYNSHKGKEIAENPNVCLNFFWPDLERQVRIEGIASLAGKEVSDNYFHSRPSTNKIGAWASPQSKVLKDRKELEYYFTISKEKFSGNDIPRPEFWGGYIVKPNVVEFWQGRPSRLHDRLRYRLENEKWILERLAP